MNVDLNPYRHFPFSQMKLQMKWGILNERIMSKRQAFILLNIQHPANKQII